MLSEMTSSDVSEWMAYFQLKAERQHNEEIAQSAKNRARGR